MAQIGPISPSNIQALRKAVTSRQASAAGKQAAKQAGLSQMPRIAKQVFMPTPREMKSLGFKDMGAGSAILNCAFEAGAKGGKIDGDSMEKLIHNGTKDLDNQAAGKEFQDLNKFVKRNWNNLTPDAKAKWRVYEGKVGQMKSQGKTGIPANEYNQMMKDIKKTGYADNSAGKAIEDLKDQGKEKINGHDMEKLVYNATKDLDNQAAGKEYKDLSNFVKENWGKMTPNAKQKWQVYENTAKKMQAQGKTGIPVGEYNNMLREMKETGYKDRSAGKAIEELKGKPGPITGNDMERLIYRGTKDLDGQAAGKEYQDLSKFVKDNWNKMTPDAKAKWSVYDNTAKKMQAQGKTGIPLGTYHRMMRDINAAGYQDKGAGRAIENFKAENKGKITGDEMMKLVHNATKDFDNQAAGAEFNDLDKFVKQNWSKMTPDAKKKWGVYKNTVQGLRMQGKTGIPYNQYQDMLKNMRLTGYKDRGAGEAIEALKSQPNKPINGQDMEKLIFEGTRDLDAQAAGKEFDDINKFVKDNWNRLTPNAKQKFRVYERTARTMRMLGNQGIPMPVYNRMMNRIRATGYQDASAGRAIESLRGQPKPISGADMEKMIIDATKDRDAQAAGKEFNDIARFVGRNWNNLSAEAKQKFQVYQKFAHRARRKGQTGIDARSYNNMIDQMRATGYQDRGAGKVLSRLENKPGRIDGNEMQKAIVDATKDLDNQAAGREYNDIKKFVTNNWNRMTPDAKEKFRVYERHVLHNQRRGRTGIPMGEYNAMVNQMSAAGYEDKSAAKAIEDLKSTPGTISGDQMEEAIFRGTRDLDGQAAGKEFNDFAEFAKANWHRMSPDAREKFRIYEDHAMANRMQGRTGIPVSQYNDMMSEMRLSGYNDASAGKAIEGLKDKDGPITAMDMQRAIIDGTKDFDNQAAFNEFMDFNQFAMENWDNMTSEAREVFDTYAGYALDALANGQTGINVNDYNQMKMDMAQHVRLPFFPRRD